MYYKRNYGAMPRTFSGLMEEIAHNGWAKLNEEVSSFTAPVNIQETDKSYELHLVAAGLKKDDFKISLDKDILNIAYDQKEQKEDGQEQPKEKWLRSEYRMKSFKRSFTLNEKVDATGISAKYNDGILVVTLPKKEVSEPVKHEIAVN